MNVMAQTLFELRERRKARKAALDRALEDLKRQLVALGAREIILFGSLAEGRVRSTSDLDLLVIMPPTKSGKAWMREIYARLDRSVECDILAFTRAELEARLPNSRFLRHIMTTGRTVYEAPTRD